MEIGIQKSDGLDSRLSACYAQAGSTNCGNDRVHHFTRTVKIITDGSGHALGGSAFGTTSSLSTEDDPVGSFKIRSWREPKHFGSIIMIEPAGHNEKKRLHVRMKDSDYLILGLTIFLSFERNMFHDRKRKSLNIDTNIDNMFSKYKKILIMEAGGIGDMIMSTPALKAIRKRFSNSEITLLTVPRSAQALNNKRYANKIIYFKQESFSKGPSRSIYNQVFSNLGLLWSLRKERFDTMIDLEAIETWKSSLLRYIFYICVGAGNKVGRNSDGKGFFLDVKVHDNLFGTVHEVDRKLLIASTLGAEADDTKQEFYISTEDREFINNWLLDSGISDNRTIVAMQPGAFVPTRQWKSEGFIEVAKKLYQKYKAQIILTGGSNDNVVYKINDELKDVDPILAIGFPLGRLGALFELVQLFISNDTGPFHIADALNIPFVVIFGPENSYRYGPYNTKSKSRIVTGMKISCSPCLKYECRTHECMESITSEMVWEEVESLMKEINK